MNRETVENIMMSDYSRIAEGESLNLRGEPYKVSYLKKILTLLESREQYEDCINMKSIINRYINHDSNYKHKKHTF